ncbi:lysophospholipid acyltransferase family protein [Fundicoccus culcitae]|uniref:1-acyl-sn-glycerol-3-phosphate acyltransferase n=1 Tax=Fundicoccus culcitae TaxID=2969821 RepID=A0ABY5P780_9LACT|nr:1-acyl-sn-glycerol-3-phosphate acyltransferase [Fundicoccus culcitae]UUX34598.1 1-acyl-sn-glycerol-3-phosphate acyltransferase [Fundicoccus culcitae]
MSFYTFMVKVFYVLFIIFNGKPHVEGKEHLENIDASILTSTHRSMTDPFFVAFVAAPHEVSFMAKQSLFQNKLLNYLLTKANVFPINREKPSTKTIRHAADELNEHNRHLGIFATGSRYSTEIKSGTAFIQRLSKKNIIPIAIQPPIGFWQFISRKKAKIAIGSPIEYDPSKKYTKEELAEIDALIGQRFDELDKQLDPTYVYQVPTKTEK